ncbi:hypothetical protein FDP41_000381 [Naegleria fowleri]|uniref:Uncharacterized protein n=1 Tax=Naegleria fowleri TaxID=5763 RepID=A0A6A5CBQ4_NAEFO|nr:uncharacterized protein FDP41_000381 [Naegleria fowleri]KAF0984482.1 hypothetical protein FDP41_000381 [Naegleria fowleri]
MCSLVNNAVNQQKDTFEKREKACKSTKTRRAKLVEEGKCSECGHDMDNVALTNADKEFLNDGDVLLVEGSSSTSTSSSNSSTNILDYGDEMDSETLFDDNGFIRTTFLRPRCQQCLRKHNERERQKYHKVKEEGVMCPSHPSMPLEVCDPELGTTAFLKCGLVHMGKQFASLKCCSTHSMGRPPQCLPACSLCGIIVENLYQAVAACIHHLKFQMASKTKRSFICTKYFATAFRKEKDPNWFKTEEPLEILCKACHHLPHAVYLMEKQGTQTEDEEKVLDDFNEWVQVHIKMVRLLGAKCAKCEMDFEKLGLAFFILARIHQIKTDGADQRRSATHILELEDRDEIAAHVNEYTLALEGKQPNCINVCVLAVIKRYTWKRMRDWF